MSENTQKKARSIEMVTGSLWKNIILFSIPLMCSQLLEVLFNLSDVAVVGRFADYKALGAVGSTTFARHIVCRISDWYGKWSQCPCCPRTWCRKAQRYRGNSPHSTSFVYDDGAPDRSRLFLLFLGACSCFCIQKMI